MQWSELDLQKKVWTIPGERTKTGRAFRLPLSSRALHVLQEQKTVAGDSPFVFPSLYGKVLSDATLSKMVRQCGISAVPHGFRSSFRSWCADVNIERELAESCLAHTVQGTEGRYQRSDLFERRRVVMERWADYVTKKAPAKVVSLR